MDLDDISVWPVLENITDVLVRVSPNGVWARYCKRRIYGHYAGCMDYLKTLSTNHGVPYVLRVDFAKRTVACVSDTWLTSPTADSAPGVLLRRK